MSEKNEYVKLWLSYESYFQPYTTEEVGRLVLAMLSYKRAGIEPEFTGNEKFVWAAIKRDIDTQASAQEAISEIRRECGRLGGRPPKTAAPPEAEEKQKNQMLFEKSNAFLKSKKSYGKGEGKGEGKGKGQGQGQGQGLVQERKLKQMEDNAQRKPSFCAEPESGSTPETAAERPKAAPVIALPLNDGTEYQIFAEQCHEWAGLYPAVDVIQQLRNMRGWLLSNAAKRKTKRGILRFVTNWLAREQDKGSRNSGNSEKPTAGVAEGTNNAFLRFALEEQEVRT